MVNGYFHEYLLSVNEYGACLYMAGYTETGAAYFREVYPRIKGEKAEKMVEEGRRSLAARRLALENGLTLERNLENAIHTAMRFTKMLQVMLNDTKEGVQLIANIFIEDGKFTANWEEHEQIGLFYAGVEDIPNLICDWANLSKSAAPEFPAEMRKIGIHTLTRLGRSPFGVKRYLRDQGYRDPYLSEMIDLHAPVKRGSVMLVEVGADKIHEADFEQAGAGVLFTEGPKYCWVFRFDEMNPTAIGEMVEGSQAQLKEEIARLVGRTKHE